MLFSSTTFLFAFLPIVLITYYIVPRITRNLVLFIFSLVFYAWGEPVYIVLMIASTIVAYITGLLADKQRKSAKKYTPLIAMIGAVVWNIGLLLFFKYTDFFIGAANSIFGTQIKTLGLALPIGISFYSFQTLSYVIDVYKGEVRSQKNFLDLATYVALFPQLIAGPIVRYIDVAEQLKKRNESIEQFCTGRVEIFHRSWQKSHSRKYYRRAFRHYLKLSTIRTERCRKLAGHNSLYLPNIL